MNAKDLRLGNTVGMWLNDSTPIRVTVDIYHLSCMLNNSRKYFPIDITVEELRKLKDNMHDEHTGDHVLDGIEVKKWIDEEDWVIGTASYYVFMLRKISNDIFYGNSDGAEFWRVINPDKKDIEYAKICYIHELQNILYAMVQGVSEIIYKESEFDSPLKYRPRNEYIV